MIIVKKSHLLPGSRWLNAKPGRIITLSFLLVIIVGSLLLSLPVASQDGKGIPYIQALFTATSATCVTGLVTVDTNLHWTIFGKVVIITLIQIGGLGLVTITTFFYTLLRRKATLKTMVVAQESTANFSFVDVLKLVRRIIAITLAFEFTGGLILSWRFSYRYPLPQAIGKGFFQSVSAFCNAGFDLHGTVDEPFQSLVHFNDDPIVLITTGLLIIIGGLGFVVWADIGKWPRERKLTFHTRLVLLTTAILLVVGTVFFLLSEWRNQPDGVVALGNLPVGQRVLAAWFQSVTPRTAGFNSIDQMTLSEAGRFMTVLLMFIGAAPGSTGGGIKVSTFAVILATVISDIRSRNEISLLRKRLTRETFTRAFVIAALGMGIVVTATMLITIFEQSAFEAGKYHFLDVVYESTSAFATVGLTSLGTKNLQVASWATLIPAMFLGRVGPVSFAISMMVGRSGPQEAVKPEGKVLVG